MIDEAWNVYLIEVNTNPWLETPCPLLQSIISSVIDNTFKITLDVLFPCPENAANKPSSKAMIDVMTNLSKFELIYC